MPNSSLISQYIIDESAITERLGFSVPPIRVFSLERLGIDTERFIDYMKPAFSILPLDRYDAKRNQVAFLKARFPDEEPRLSRFLEAYYDAHEDLDSVVDLIARLMPTDMYEFDRIGITSRRKRSLARFMLHALPNGCWQIDRVHRLPFIQNVSDLRGKLRRVFAETNEFVTDYPDMRKLISKIADMVRELRPEARALELNLHLMYTFADLMSAGENAPEGIHQDGCDYIVSALVIERAGIVGGESIVYGPDKKTEYLRRTLAPGEGIFQADRGSPLWHYVTPIQEDPAVSPDYGHRAIIGFDVDVVA